MTKPVTEVTKLVTHEESLTLLNAETGDVGKGAWETDRRESLENKGERREADRMTGSGRMESLRHLIKKG